jgi:hypothetical protein
MVSLRRFLILDGLDSNSLLAAVTPFVTILGRSAAMMSLSKDATWRCKAMSRRTATRLAWSLCIACLVGLGGYLLLYVLNGTAGLGSTPLLVALTFTVVGALFAVVGALVASRQPGNKVGWLLLAAGLCLAVSLLRRGLRPLCPGHCP